MENKKSNLKASIDAIYNAMSDLDRVTSLITVASEVCNHDSGTKFDVGNSLYIAVKYLEDIRNNVVDILDGYNYEIW